MKIKEINLQLSEPKTVGEETSREIASRLLSIFLRVLAETRTPLYPHFNGIHSLFRYDGQFRIINPIIPEHSPFQEIKVYTFIYIFYAKATEEIFNTKTIFSLPKQHSVVKIVSSYISRNKILRKTEIFLISYLYK